MDLTRPRAYVYHATEPPKMVYSEDVQEWYDKGWKSSPAYFFDMKEHGLDNENEALAQATGDSIEGVKNAVNDALNLRLMTKREIVSYAKKNLKLNLSVETLKSVLIREVEDCLNSEGD